METHVGSTPLNPSPRPTAGVTVTVHMSVDVAYALSDYCDTHGVTKKSVIERAVSQFIERTPA